ncbi:MAG: hydroxymethylglutaryl-CoA synthase [Spirochaetaceae bacterium]|nr:hydroxymethylglutaryl-CoA synthase [Spirochaetaceae bacterium]
MSHTAIGIGDIALYLPDPNMNMQTLMESRSKSNPQLVRIMNRAIEHTGQLSFRFPEPWEDTASMAANSAAEIMDRLKKEERSRIRYISLGTETAVDHAKPAASYVQGMLNDAGYELGTSMTTYEVKHACAGGTAALLSAASMLSLSGKPEEKALAISSDIARYDAPSTAEITQGAGAVSLLVEKNPRLLELDLSTQGLFASDVDDFFRPLDSVTAKVKGRYSMDCYQEALEKAFADFCERKGSSSCRVIDEIDYIALHVPFARMPETALRKLLKNSCGKDEDEIEHYLNRTGFLEAMYLSKTFGNLYNASLYTYLAALLQQEYKKIGKEIIGKTILIASYGSGNTMMVYSATIAEKAPEVISRWDLEKWSRSSRSVDFKEYSNWLERPENLDAWKEILNSTRPIKNRFYLKDFSKTGLRIYSRG